MKGVLEGIRVLDLSRVIAGPYCAFLMAVMGAEVIRVEKPGGEMDWDIGAPIKDGPGRICHPLYTSCNKEGITLDLRQEKGRNIFADLVKKSDVVVHNYSFQAARAMGLIYEKLEAINPGIILAAISGFGQTGPYRERNCWDPQRPGHVGHHVRGGISRQPAHQNIPSGH